MAHDDNWRIGGGSSSTTGMERKRTVGARASLGNWTEGKRKKKKQTQTILDRKTRKEQTETKFTKTK